MPINFSAPPDQVIETLRSGLNSSALSLIVDSADSTNLKVLYPHRIFEISVKDVLDATGTDCAIMKGWAFVLIHRQRPLALATVTTDQEGEHPKFTNLITGPLPTSILNNIGRAQNQDQIIQDDFELRLLTSPGLHALALWLRSSTRDLVWPLSGAPALNPTEATVAISPSRMSVGIDAEAYFQRLRDSVAHIPDIHLS